MPRDEETISKIKEKEDLFNKITKHYPWSMGKFIEFIYEFILLFSNSY